jgi:hypothetical protein
VERYSPPAWGSGALICHRKGDYPGLDLSTVRWTAALEKGPRGTRGDRVGFPAPVHKNISRRFTCGPGRREWFANSSLLPATGAGVTAKYGGTHVPEIVSNIRVDQAWGLFQLSDSLHNVTASYKSLTLATAQPAGAVGATSPFGNSELSGHPEDKWGGSVMAAALQIKNLPTGPGDDIKIDATYAVGRPRT